MGGKRPLLFWLILCGAMLSVEVSLTFETWFLGYWAQQYEDHDPSEIRVT